MKAKLFGFINPKQAIIKYPESDQTVPAHYARAYAYHLGAYPDKALSEAEALLKTNPHDPYFLELKGQILLEGGKPAEAIAPLREATEQSARCAADRLHARPRADLDREDKKNYAEAKTILKTAVARDNENPFAWYQLGIIYDQEGDQRRAPRLPPPSATISKAIPSSRWPVPKWPCAEFPPALRTIFALRTSPWCRKTELKKDKKGKRDRENKGSSLGAAIAGGIIGAVLTLAVLRSRSAAIHQQPDRAARHARTIPQILVDAADALRDRQYAPTLASYPRRCLETPFGSSWKGAEKPEVVLVEFYDYACPYCKASNPHVDQLLRENPGLRVVYRELPILGQNSVEAARLSLAASKAGRFREFHDALYAAGRPAPETNAAAARVANIPPNAVAGSRRSKPSSRATSSWPASSAPRARRSSSSATGS